MFCFHPPSFHEAYRTCHLNGPVGVAGECFVFPAGGFEVVMMMMAVMMMMMALPPALLFKI